MKLIQLSTLDLEQKIESEIGENPALENGIEKKSEEDQEDSFDDQSKINKTEIDGTNFEEYLNGKIATIGENIVARKMVNVSETRITHLEFGLNI